MDEVLITQNTSLINSSAIKKEVLHTFDNIDGELNLIMINGSGNSEVPRNSTDVKNEVGSKAAQTEKDVDHINCNLVNGNMDLKLENKDHSDSPSNKMYEDAVTDQNSNLTFAVTKNNLKSSSKKSNEVKAGSKKSLRNKNSSEVNTNESSNNDLILTISDDSDDTDEVDSDSSDDGINVIIDCNNEDEFIHEDESHLEEPSVLENHEGDESLNQTSNMSELENSVTKGPRLQNKRRRKSNANQSTLLKFLVPRQPQDSPRTIIENDVIQRPMIARLSISKLIMNSCVYCIKGYTSIGTNAKKCRDCGKRMKLHCFMCEKVYDTRSGIYSHVIQHHRFSLKLFNERIYSFIKNICLKCKSTFDPNRTFCSKCRSNLLFGCVVCDEQFETRFRIHMHVVKSHVEHFIANSPKKGDTNYEGGRQNKTEESLLNDGDDEDEDEDQIEGSLIEENTASSKNSDTNKRFPGKRRVRFQLDNTETDKESEIEDLNDSETLRVNPRRSGRGRAKIISNHETRSKNNNIINKSSTPKQNVSNRRQSNSFTEAIVNNEAGLKEQVVGKRRGSKINLNSSETNSTNEVLNSNGFSFKTFGAAPNNSARRRSLPLPMQNNVKSVEDFPSKTKNQVGPNKRRNSLSVVDISKISNKSDKNTITNDTAFATPGPTLRSSNKRRSAVTEKEENTKGDGQNFEPKQQISSKRRRSKSISDNSEISKNLIITLVDVHSVPVKNEPKQQIAAKRRSSRITSSSNEANSHDESTLNREVATPDIPDPKQSVMQLGRRRSLVSSKAMPDINEIKNYSETSLDTTAASDTSASSQQIQNKRRKSQSFIKPVGHSEISVNENNNEISDTSDALHCSVCQQIFEDQVTCKKHEIMCGKDANKFCDSCSFVTKYPSNLKKHKRTKHDTLKNSETHKVNLSTSNLFNGTVDYGVQYTVDSTCTDILNKMEAHCPKCTDNTNIKPNDSHCRKCKSKLTLSCVKCSNVFTDFLNIFNHLYKECSDKQYQCAQCTFTTTSLDIIESHIQSTHSDKKDITSSSAKNKKSDTPFVFAAQPKAPVVSDDVKMKLRVGFKTRAQNRVKPKEKLAVEATKESESKLKVCSKCNSKVPSHALMKHLMQCKSDVKCPFCMYTTKTKFGVRRHMVRCHSTKKHTVKFQELFSNAKYSTDRPDVEEMMLSYCKTCDDLQKSIPYEFNCTSCSTYLEYRCAKCPVRYKQREQLRKHVWTHAKKRNLSCTGCSKRFAFVENLRMHQKICTAAMNETI